MTIREIHIKPALNGYICRVGCQTVVFDERNKLLSALSSYLKDPKATELSFLKGALNLDDCPQEAPRGNCCTTEQMQMPAPTGHVLQGIQGLGGNIYPTPTTPGNPR